MYRIYVFIAVLFVSSVAFANSMSEEQKISGLLNYLETSNVIFVRNGEEHSVKEAKEHLQMKLKKAGNHVKTANDFIARIASKSSMSGKPYYVKLSDGTMIESEKWLRKKLAEIEAK
jgi:hypothetical protein